MVFKIKSPHEKYKSEQSKDRPLQKEGRSGAMLCLPVTPAVICRNGGKRKIPYTIR